MYRLNIKRSAEKDLQRLPPKIFQRINSRILLLREEPYPSGVKMLKGNFNGWRIRVGDYRVVYTLDEELKTITIIRVRHRRDVYRF